MTPSEDFFLLFFLHYWHHAQCILSWKCAFTLCYPYNYTVYGSSTPLKKGVGEEPLFCL